MSTPKNMLDYEVVCALASVRTQEIKVREAKNNLEQGYIKAKAELEREYFHLKSELESAQADLDRCNAWLALKKNEQEKGFSET